MTEVETLKKGVNDNITELENEAKELLKRLQKIRQDFNECETVEAMKKLDDSVTDSLDNGFKFLRVF